MREFLPEIKFTSFAVITGIVSLQNITETLQLIAAGLSALTAAIAFYKAFKHRYKK